VLGCVAPALLLSACTFDGAVPTAENGLSAHFAALPADDHAPAAMNSQIGRYAALYQVPESLIRRIIVRESGYNPHARHGPYWGLMQIRYDTACSMGYQGSPAGLLDADTNLRYAVKYLAGAYRVAGGNPDRAVHFYAAGYYYDARRMGLLEDVGLKRAK
jgi:soluble lytic murein transglycosylase-like protein